MSDGDFFASTVWWDVVAACVPSARMLRVAGGVIPVRDDGGLAALTLPYTGSYQPVLTAPREAGREFAAYCKNTVRLDAIPAEWPDFAEFRAGLREGRRASLVFDHFGNWHLPVAGIGWSDYLAGRPGALREAIRRRGRKLASARFELIEGLDGLEAGMAAYEAVYSASWKAAEPVADFNTRLMRATAAQGWLRLAILWLERVPIAAQFWVVFGGRATVLKLAYDEAHKSLSPGTVLMARVIERLLDRELVAALDFGRGDDAYKRDWTGERRQRLGLLIVNPASPRGVLALARHHAGRLIQRG